ncbi:MAG TPA: cytochrome P450 [Acetobacteraceae bacterium]|nr:cytochrome P450 [Acetobacteraceae bacterium]
MDTLAHRRYVPPVPTPPPAPLPMRQFLRAIRENALTIWPERAYHDDMTVRQFLGRTNVLLNEPEAIHRVLVENHANYRRSAASIRILRPITGNGLLLSMGEAWRLQRRTVAPALGPRVIPLLSRHIMAATQEALNALDQSNIDLLTFIQALALDIAGRSMFSLETRQYGPEIRRLLTEFGDRFAQPHLLDMLVPASVPTLRDWRRARFSKRWMHLIETMMQQRIGNPNPSEQPRDLLDLLISARDPETGAGFSPAELRDQVATLLLAGHETTAVTLFWACLMLANAPDVQNWLAEELPGVDLTQDGVLARLVRTRAVVNETLRLFPAAFTLAREAIQPDQLGTLQLPRRAVVMIAPWVLHRHHAFWPDPGAFNPARFMPDAPPPPRFAFMPFGAGPRICVGAQFAMAEAVLVLAAFVQRFQIALRDTRPVLPVAVVTTQPDHAPLFQLTRRPSSQ